MQILSRVFVSRTKAALSTIAFNLEHELKFHTIPPMPASNPLPASTPQPLPRNKRMIPPKDKIHPAVKAGIDNFMATHGGKFAQNAGRGFKRGRE